MKIFCGFSILQRKNKKICFISIASLRSHESAKVVKVLEGYKVYLTPHVKPEREQMSDIIKCSGGEALNFDPSLLPGEKVIVVTCEGDLSMCKAAMEAGVPVHSTELILGGVLRQELELRSYPSNPCSPHVYLFYYSCTCHCITHRHNTGRYQSFCNNYRHDNICMQ